MVGSSCHNPGTGTDFEVRHRYPEGRGDRKFRERFRLDAFHVIHYKPEAVPHVHYGCRNAPPDLGGKHQAGRQGLAYSYSQIVYFEFRFCICYERTYLEHVGLEDRRTVSGEVEGVILEEGTSFRKALCHEPYRAIEGSSLPVTFGSESVAFVHQPLGCKSRDLVEAHSGDLDIDISKVVEVGGEALGSLVFKEGA